MPPCSGTHDSSTRSSTSTSSRYPLLRDGHATGQRSLDEPIKYRDSKPIGKRAHAHCCVRRCLIDRLVLCQRLFIGLRLVVVQHSSDPLFIPTGGILVC